MNAKFYPQVLSGKTEAQALKTLAMRYFVLACFAKGNTKIYLKNENEDFSALKDALSDLGASIYRQNSVYTIMPPQDVNEFITEVNVKNSLATFRLLVPMLSTKLNKVDYVGSGKLTRKDVTMGTNIFKGVTLNSKTLPMETKGNLEFGEFVIEPDVNSQLVCALIMALPLLGGDSVVRFSDKPKKQLSYQINLTLNAMSDFGVEVEKIDNGIKISGGKEYIAPQGELKVEGDYSTAVYFFATNILGGNVEVENLSQDSIQPEKDVLKYIKAVEEKEQIEIKGKSEFIYLLTALASAKPKKTVFTNFKIKNEDKFLDFISMLQRLGASVSLEGERITVVGKEKLSGGVMLDSLDDANIAMSLIVLTSVMENPVTILSVETANLEQPSFINEFIKLNGKCEIV